METNEIFGYLGVAPESDDGQPGQGGTADPQGQSGAAANVQEQPAGELGQGAGSTTPTASMEPRGSKAVRLPADRENSRRAPWPAGDPP